MATEPDVKSDLILHQYMVISWTLQKVRNAKSNEKVDKVAVQ